MTRATAGPTVNNPAVSIHSQGYNKINDDDDQDRIHRHHQGILNYFQPWKKKKLECKKSDERRRRALHALRKRFPAETVHLRNDPNDVVIIEGGSWGDGTGKTLKDLMLTLRLRVLELG